MAERIRPNDTFSPIEFRAGHQYVLELRQLPLADKFRIVKPFGIKIAHNFWVLRDKTLGHDIAQIHGFPFNEEIGQPERGISHFDGERPLKFLQLPGNAYSDRKNIVTIHEIPLTAEEARKAWHGMVTGLKYLNDRNIGYRADGYDPARRFANSNVTAYTVGRLLGRTPEQLKETGKKAPFSAPGWAEWNLFNDFPDAPAPEGTRDEGVLPRMIHPTPGDGSMAPGEGDKESRSMAHRFSGGAGDDVLAGSATNDDLLAEADRLIGSDDYWHDPHKQRRVAALFKRLYPGTLRTAPLGFGDGA